MDYRCNAWTVFVVFAVFQVTFVTGFDKKGDLNDPCIVVSDCKSIGYFCSKNRTCQCIKQYYIPSKNWDRCVGFVGEKCKYDEHCIEGAFCQGNIKCKCKDEYFLSEDGRTCSSSAPSMSPSSAINQKLFVPVAMLTLVFKMLFFNT